MLMDFRLPGRNRSEDFSSKCQAIVRLSDSKTGERERERARRERKKKAQRRWKMGKASAKTHQLHSAVEIPKLMELFMFRGCCGHAKTRTASLLSSIGLIPDQISGPTARLTDLKQKQDREGEEDENEEEVGSRQDEYEYESASS